jgi:hypothetical protein
VSRITLIGLDCATQPKNTGVAWAVPDGEALLVREARCASSEASAVSLVARWIDKSQRELARHRAGAPLSPAAHAMFRRLTDDEIYKRLGKRLLEVAANRIARAAHAAQKFLEELCELKGTA